MFSYNICSHICEILLNVVLVFYAYLYVFMFLIHVEFSPDEKISSQMLFKWVNKITSWSLPTFPKPVSYLFITYMYNSLRLC